MTTLEGKAVQKPQQSPNGGLKRKNENGIEEQNIEVGIKRVALNDDNASVMSTCSSPKRAVSESDENQLSSDLIDSNNVDDKPTNGVHLYENTSPTSENDSSISISHNNDYVHIRMLCLVKDASVIVGPKGDTINQIKQATSTKINVSANLRDVPERVIFVRGSCENVSMAYYTICKYLVASKNRNTLLSDETLLNGSNLSVVSQEVHSPSSAAVSLESLPSSITSKENLTESFQEVSDENSTITVNILIPHYLMGYIIGKNGSKLKEIEEESTVRLQASPHQLLPSTDRILRVTGSPNAIRIALLGIANIINSHKDKLRNKKTVFYQPGPIYSVLGKIQLSTQPRGSVSVHIPPSASTLQYPQSQLSQSSLGTLRYRNGSNSMDLNQTIPNRRSPRLPMTMLVPSVDPRSGVAMMLPPQGFINLPSTVDADVVYTAEAAANATTFVPNMTLPNVRVEANVASTQPMAIVKQVVYIDENFVGNVIGKEGKHINSIKDTTGCSVVIDEPVETATERKLVIEGTYMGAQAAIMLISNKIEMDKFNQKMQHKV
ncbi:hypothetical protein MOSE0_N11298 [Monosporozyma servazzii]